MYYYYCYHYYIISTIMSLCLFMAVSAWLSLFIYIRARVCFSFSLSLFVSLYLSVSVPTGSPSRGGNVAVYVIDRNQPSLPTPFYSLLVSVSVFMTVSTALHSITSPKKSSLSHSVLLGLLLPYWSFQLSKCLSIKVFLSPDIIICG